MESENPLPTQNALLLLVALETTFLFLLGTLGSKLSSYLDLSPSAIIVTSAVCILFVSVIGIARQKAGTDPALSPRARRRGMPQLTPRSVLGTLPIGMCLGLLIAIPSVALFPGKLWFFAPAPFSLYQPQGETPLLLGFMLHKYELVGSTFFAAIALVFATFVGSYRAAGLVAGWAVGASAAVCMLRPQENLIW